MTEAPPRPDPVFFEGSRPLLTKKDSQARRRRQPRPPRVVPSVGSTSWRSDLPRHAQAVSFSGSEWSFHSSHYNEHAPVSYLHQCFYVDQKLGEGSFGVVYKVRCLDDGRWYAVKVANRQFRGQRDRRRQLEEVAKHELLPPHPHCVRFIKAWEEDYRLYIQTELCECSLATYTEKHHNLSEQLVWEFLVDLSLGVKHLHDHDLAHLDIKPENIFISKNGYYKLGDFGLVLDLKRDDPSDPLEGDPCYLAPELMEGHFTKAADIFSLGITVLELACDLELPSRGENWHALRSGTLPHHLAQCLSPQLHSVIQQMMHPDPQQRITADQLLALPDIRQVRLRRKLYVARKRAVSWVQDMLLLTWFWVQSYLVATWRVPRSCIKPLFASSRPSVAHRTSNLDTDCFSDGQHPSLFGIGMTSGCTAHPRPCFPPSVRGPTLPLHQWRST
ncbi:membrane-associated tyrosine- and threonine-specific cdc2-inhibitory kinase isoform X2 [Dermacentor silvarum]|uniref:membrane-associated tyrosine- and threonine-specific cdc2-inhibitory kinase isoform X2 n=1 Tax=Dermacentor silvarum TaxID=543639 RepID=UPI0021015EA8|nr:membrane-associated tyrosine- and threonine-specific cdc2-inhibitory kinase isoform X2 [Dermacentor silvarum]